MTDMQILGSKFWALGGLNKNIEVNSCRVPPGELTAKKWLVSIEKQKELYGEKKNNRFEGAAWQTDSGFNQT